MVKEIIEGGGSLWRCQVCEYVTKQKGALFEHVESKHTLSVGYNCRGGAAYLYLISILIWPHFDTYPYISIQNILMRAQNILITKIYL